MSGKFSRALAAIPLAALLAACNSSKPEEGLETAAAPAAAAQSAVVVQANCPAVNVADANAVHTVYARGAKEDASKLAYQASLSESTRSCSVSGDNLVINVMVAGRVVTGPEGKPGRVTLPIRVTVVDFENTLFSEVTSLPVDVQPGPGATQFLYTNDHVAIPNGPGGAPRAVRVSVGFDEGKTPAKGKSGRNR